MTTPLVSIICLCHNQAPFVKDALESVWAQNYEAIELIVVEDGSSDGSTVVIEQLLTEKPDVKFLKLPHNIGNCSAFNKGLALARGKYVIDLAADDVLDPQRVQEGVKALEAAGEGYAVNFTDALYINIAGKELRSHYKRDNNGKIIETVPQGWVYSDLLQRYFVCTPSMMMRRSVLDALGGYDEDLAYEDFDFWIRSARNWQYCFTEKVLVKKRVVPGSWGLRQYEKESRQLESTLMVCAKAKLMNINDAENLALSRRLGYEIRQAIRNKHFDIAGQMLLLKKSIDYKHLEYFCYRAIVLLGLIVFPEK